MEKIFNYNVLPELKLIFQELETTEFPLPWKKVCCRLTAFLVSRNTQKLFLIEEVEEEHSDC